MPDCYLQAICVRPILPEERARFDAELDEYHWLGHRLVGETMRHVAVDPDGRWVALLGFGAAALACRPREERIGWSDEVRFRRLRYVVSNQRYCVLPSGQHHNLASFVLARSLRRLSDDFEARWGHRVLAVETFVDPTRHAGTCYVAAGFESLGESRGFGRRGGRYVHHGQPKRYLAKTLRKDAFSVLASPFDHPLLARGGDRMIDLNKLCFEGQGGLLAALERVADHRKARGVRYSLASVLAIMTAATLAGSRSVAAIGEWAADCPQDVLARLGAKYHPVKHRYIAPHTQTFRNILRDLDCVGFDRAVGAWLFEQVREGRVSEEQIVLALDGKSMRGSLREDGRAVHLFAAMVHGEGVVVGQEQVDEKSNEITALRPLLEPLDLEGALVTADALHCQRDHAAFIVEDKKADYLLQVKGNQPKLFEALKAIPAERFSKQFASDSRGHGRIERRFVRVADVPENINFPHAAQVVLVYRERANLADVMTSAETSYYITSVSSNKAGADRLGQNVREHWGIESLHWVRDWTFDEDRHRHRATRSPARALATIRNTAISLLRLAGATQIAAATRWVGRDATRAAALLGV